MAGEHNDNQKQLRRRVQAYLPSEEMRREFEADAEDRGGVSSFVTYLYRQYKKAQQQSNEGEGKRAA